MKKSLFITVTLMLALLGWGIISGGSDRPITTAPSYAESPAAEDPPAGAEGEPVGGKKDGKPGTEKRPPTQPGDPAPPVKKVGEGTYTNVEAEAPPQYNTNTGGERTFKFAGTDAKKQPFNVVITTNNDTYYNLLQSAFLKGSYKYNSGTGWAVSFPKLEDEKKYGGLKVAMAAALNNGHAHVKADGKVAVIDQAQQERIIADLTRDGYLARQVVREVRQSTSTLKYRFDNFVQGTGYEFQRFSENLQIPSANDLKKQIEKGLEGVKSTLGWHTFWLVVFFLWLAWLTFKTHANYLFARSWFNGVCKHVRMESPDEQDDRLEKERQAKEEAERKKKEAEAAEKKRKAEEAEAKRKQAEADAEAKKKAAAATGTTNGNGGNAAATGTTTTTTTTGAGSK